MWFVSGVPHTVGGIGDVICDLSCAYSPPPICLLPLPLAFSLAFILHLVGELFSTRALRV